MYLLRRSGMKWGRAPGTRAKGGHDKQASKAIATHALTHMRHELKMNDKTAMTVQDNDEFSFSLSLSLSTQT